MLTILAMLTVVAQCFISLPEMPDINEPAYFTIDTMLHMYDEGTDTYQHISESGTTCTLYVKHGSNTAMRWTDDIEDPSRNLIALTNNGLWNLFSTEDLTTMTFPYDQDVSHDQNTWFWTSCNDALLIDYMLLEAHDGTTQWGYDNQVAWCLSGESDDAYDFNKYGSPYDWTPVPYSFGCFSAMRLQPDGEVWGWLNNNNDFSGWEDDAVSHGRRLFQEEFANLPTAAAVRDCEQDADRLDSECALLVDQILNFEETHSQGWQRAVLHPLPAEVVERKKLKSEEKEEELEISQDEELETSQDEELETSQDEEQEEVAPRETVSQTDLGSRRRLFDLLQRFQ